MPESQRFRIVSELRDVEKIAEGPGIRERRRLERTYGAGHWRKLKEVAVVELADAALFEVELHWYECHGIGRRDFKIKRYLKRL